MSHKPTVTRFAQDRISASMFYKYDACPHWLYFDAYGDQSKKAPTTEFSDMLREGGVIHEKKVVSEMQCVTPKGETNEEKFTATVKMMRDGVPCIYQGLLMDDEFIGKPDLLERRDGVGSNFGSYHYVPVEIKNAERLSDAHKYQLCCYGKLLERIQGTTPEEGYVLNASGIRISFLLREFQEQFNTAVEEIRKTLAGDPPPPHVASSCKQSPWFKECIALAEKQDDIALLYNVKKKVVMALREYGIRTVHDAANMEAERLSKEDPLFKRALLDRIVLQATALIEHRHFVRKPIDLPEAPLEIFFDIEGDPLRQVEYLFGFLVRPSTGSGPDGHGKEEYVSQLAEKPEDEKRMWTDFLAWMETLEGDYVVYHYGAYELTRIITLEARYGGTQKLNVFRDRLVDLNEIVKEAIVFPLYFYGIKDIGKYIGFTRDVAIAGGGESVAFYEDWLKNGDRKVLDAIVRYNTDDVVATRYLKDWLAKERDVFRAEQTKSEKIKDKR